MAVTKNQSRRSKRRRWVGRAARRGGIMAGSAMISPDSLLFPRLPQSPPASRAVRRLSGWLATGPEAGMAAVAGLAEAVGISVARQDERLVWVDSAGDTILLALRPAAAPLGSAARQGWRGGELVSPAVAMWRRLRESGVAWGVTTDGLRLRLQHRDAPPDRHLTLDLAAAHRDGDTALLAQAVALVAGRDRGGALRDRWWEQGWRWRERAVGRLGRLLAAARDRDSAVSPLDRWAFLAHLAGRSPRLAAALDTYAQGGDGWRHEVVVGLVAHGWPEGVAAGFCGPLADWWGGGGEAAVEQLSEGLGTEARGLLAALAPVDFARAWEGRRRAAEQAQDGVLYRLADDAVARVAGDLAAGHQAVVAALGGAHGVGDEGAEARTAWAHLDERLAAQEATVAGITLLDLAPGRGGRLAVWVARVAEAVVATAGYVSPWAGWSEAEEMAEVRAAARRGLYAVAEAESDPALLLCPLTTMAPAAADPDLARRLIAGDWRSAAPLTELASPLAARRPRPGQANLFDHTFREHLRMVRRDLHLQQVAAAGAHIPEAVRRSAARARLGADVVNAWLAGEPIPWDGVEQAVAQVRGNGDSAIEGAAWCDHARAWARDRGLLYLELTFSERLLPEGRLGFTVVAARAGGGRRGGERIRRRLHALLVLGGVAMLFAERGGADRLVELAGASPLPVVADPAGRLCVWRRGAGEED